MIQIDIDPLELGRNYPNQVGLMDDGKVAVQRLIENIDQRFTKKEWAQKAQQCVQKWEGEIKPFRYSNAIPILPERLCKEITDSLPPNSTLVSDTGFSSGLGGNDGVSHPSRSTVDSICWFTGLGISSFFGSKMWWS